MDPTEKNWIEKYLEQRSAFDFLANMPSDISFEQKLYKYLQPAGIIYGHPIDLPSQIEIDTSGWPVKERLEVILFESLLAAYLIKNNSDNTPEELNTASISIKDFYEKVSPELSKLSLFERAPKTELQSLERFLSKRVNVKAEWNKNFWPGFFHNILLFGDVITFVYHLDNPRSSSAELREFVLDLHRQIIYLLSSVLDVNHDTKEQNIRYFHFFVESTVLPKEEKKDALNWHNQVFHNEFKLKYKESNWLRKKYVLDMAVLSVWADQSVSVLEEEFLSSLAQNLDLDSVELEASGFAVESFVLNNWNKVHYLQQKQSYLDLSRRLTSRMKIISKKYGSFIKVEIEENKELVALLKLSHERQLSIDEKDLVRRHLVDILKLIPAFVVLVMPLAFLTIPILMRIIPKEFFPSSFNPNALTAPRRQGRNSIIEG